MTKQRELLELDLLPERSEADIAAQLRSAGLMAFEDHDIGLVAEDGSPVRTGFLRFECGFLMAVQSRCPNQSGGSTYSVSVDLHDYRAAVLDGAIVAAASERFAETVRSRIEPVGAARPALELGSGIDQGLVYLSVEAEGRWPDPGPIVEFLIKYFDSGLVACDLHLAFGKAAADFARRTVHPLVATLAL